MTAPTIATRVTAIVAYQFGGLKLADIEPKTRLKEDLRSDSLDAVELPMALEEEFSVQIADDAYAACSTVGDLQQLLAKLTGESA